MNKPRYVLLCILLSLPMVLFATGKQEIQDTRPTIALSILPQAYFVDRLAGEMVHTVVLVGEGQNPHSYEPSPSQMAALAKAKLWILSGSEFEIALKGKISSLYPQLDIADGTRGMQFRMLEQHGHDGEEVHTAEGLNIDRHTWLGWNESKILVTNTKDALLDLLPDQRQAIEKNYQALIEEIDTTFKALEEQLSPLSGQTVFVYHPSFGYFLDSFSLVQEAVETGGKEPTAKDLSSLIEMAKADGALAIFVQKQFPVSAAQTIAKAVGAKVVSLDPLSYDWMANIKLMGTNLAEALGAKR